jgi:hypothetical protein
MDRMETAVCTLSAMSIVTVTTGGNESSEGGKSGAVSTTGANGMSAAETAAGTIVTRDDSRSSQSLSVGRL